MAEMSIDDAISLMVETAEAVPGAYFADIALRYWGGSRDPAWECEVSADIKGDDGDRFSVWGRPPQEAIQSGVAELWRRVGPDRS